jgi:hypothetical protein
MGGASMNLQKDPIESISIALQNTFSNLGIKKIFVGWPDTKYLSVDNNLPTLAIFQISDRGEHKTSRETVHAIVPSADGLTATVYKEKLRLTYLLQLSIFTSTPQQRASLGWSIQQYLVSNPQLQIGIPGVETAVFSYKGQHNSQGETNFYQRDLTFNVTARVLDAQTTPTAKTIQFNDDDYKTNVVFRQMNLHD